MRLPRSCGVLLHPSSLPGSDGIGDLGAGAYRFIDFLASARQSLWQMLPLTPTGPGDSPYASSSTFAGNPLLISIAALDDDPRAAGNPLSNGAPVDYAEVAHKKMRRLRTELAARADAIKRLPSWTAFLDENAFWLDNYALFTTLKEVHRGRTWTEWPEPLAQHDERALARFKAAHARDIEIHELIQWAFAEQWRAIRAYAESAGVRILGDVPIFVAHDSADVWAHRSLFRLDKAGAPTVVAGVPPDYFSPTGQLWGNPLYDWAAMARTGYSWWIERFRRLFQHADIVRLDHFRGFQAHWTVPAGEETAENGEWQPGPGLPFFEALHAALGDVPIVAEDLGTITPEVTELREVLELPGMKVLQFAFGDTTANPYLPHNFEHNAVVYTGTHDNDTSLGWFRSSDAEIQQRVRDYLGVGDDGVVDGMIRLAFGTVADTAVVPLQDILGLGSEARMNTPGRGQGNWSWRFAPNALTEAHARHLAALAERYNRLPPGSAEPTWA